ncbi:PAM68 family protein [Synechococcus sp. CBW1004]|nr:PAM68 family protein [Synechococcus sp. CBW1004]
MARKRNAKGSAPRRKDDAAGPAAAKAPAGTAGRTPSLPGGTTGRGLGSARPASRTSTAGLSSGRRTNPKVIPDAVANRMARRIAIATGIPTLMGMGVFIGSYLLVSRGILDIPPSTTLLASGACFLLGLVGLSYGVLSSSWEDAPGTLLGREQIGVNISRLRDSIRAMRQGSAGGSQG